MNPIYLPVLHSILYQNNLLLRQLQFSTFNPLALLALIPCYPLFAIASSLEVRHFWKRSHEGGRDLLRWLLDPHLLLSKQMVGVAEKFA